MPQGSPSLKQSLMSMLDASVAAAVLVGLGAWGGNWLDGRMHTGPWLTICLSLLGGILGMTRMVMKALALNASEPTVKPSTPPHQPADNGDSDS